MIIIDLFDNPGDQVGASLMDCTICGGAIHGKQCAAMQIAGIAMVICLPCRDGFKTGCATAVELLAMRAELFDSQGRILDRLKTILSDAPEVKIIERGARGE